MPLIAKKRKEDALLREMMKIAEDVLLQYCNCHAKTFEITTELERQTLAAYLFGMANAFPDEKRQSPQEMKYITIGFLMAVFQYQQQAAEEFFQYLVSNLVSTDEKNVVRLIIQHGIEGYSLYQQGNLDALLNDISSIIDFLKQA